MGLYKHLSLVALSGTLLTTTCIFTESSVSHAKSAFTVKNGKLVYVFNHKIVKGYATYKKKMYKNGRLFTGKHNYLRYKNGVLFNGFYKGKLFKKGYPLDGFYKGKLYDSGKLMSDIGEYKGKRYLYYKGSINNNTLQKHADSWYIGQQLYTGPIKNNYAVLGKEFVYNSNENELNHSDYPLKFYYEYNEQMEKYLKNKKDMDNLDYAVNLLDCLIDEFYSYKVLELKNNVPNFWYEAYIPYENGMLDDGFELGGDYYDPDWYNTQIKNFDKLINILTKYYDEHKEPYYLYLDNEGEVHEIFKQFKTRWAYRKQDLLLMDKADSTFDINRLTYTKKVKAEWQSNY